MRIKRGPLLIAAIKAMTPMQQSLFGTRQYSLTQVPPKPETDKWYAERAQAKRARRAAKKGSK